MNINQKNEMVNDDQNVSSADLEHLIAQLHLSNEDVEVAKHIVGSDPAKLVKFLKERHDKPALPLW
jgi:hypothetical protein